MVTNLPTNVYACATGKWAQPHHKVPNLHSDVNSLANNQKQLGAYDTLLHFKVAPISTSFACNKLIVHFFLA